MRYRIVVLAVGLACVCAWLVLRAEHPATPIEAVQPPRQPNVLRVSRPPRDAGISGHVTTARGPLRAAARVCATCTSCEVTGTRDYVCTETDAQGAYSLTGLGSAGYRVTAAAHGFAIASADRGRPVFLEPGTHRDGVDIVLSAVGHDVVGTVVDATGGTVAGASVRLVTWGERPALTEVTSDADGRFAASLAAGSVTAIGSASGYASVREQSVVPTNDLTLVLTPAGSIGGKVLTPEGERPVAGARVAAIAQGVSASSMREAVSDEDGRFRIEGLEPSQYAVIATAPGFRGSEPRTIALSLGEAVEDAFVLVAKAHQVSGRVLIRVGELDSPCEHGWVMLGPPHPAIMLRNPAKWTDQTLAAVPPAPTTLTSIIGAGGRVQFEAVPSGSYFASVQCGGHLQHDGPDVVQVRDEDIEGLTWRSVPATRLWLNVVDERGRPVAGAQVELNWPERGSQGGGVTPLEADAEGRTETLSHLYPGVYTAVAAGGYESEPVAIEVEAGIPEASATLRVKGSAAIDVEVRDHRGAFLDGLQVTARQCQPPPAAASGEPLGAAARNAVAQGRGRYRIGPLPTGCYAVEANDSINPSAPAREQVSLSAAQLLQLNVVMNRQATLRGTVLGSDGQPLRDAWVSAFASGKSVDALELALKRLAVFAKSRVLTDAEGRFSIAGLDPAASYDVKVEQLDGASTVRRGVTPNDPVTIALPETGTIEGTVTDARGRALDSFRLRVVETETQRSESRDFVHAGGRFALAGVTPGQLEIQAIEPAGQIAELRARLESGQALRDLQLSLAQ